VALGRLAFERRVCERASNSFLGTAINAFASLSKFSKDWRVSLKLGGTLVFFGTQPLFRFPRFWRGRTLPDRSLMIRFGFAPLADQFVVGKAASGQSGCRFHEPISISSFASVESKSLFV